MKWQMKYRYKTGIGIAKAESPVFELLGFIFNHFWARLTGQKHYYTNYKVNTSTMRGWGQNMDGKTVVVEILNLGIGGRDKR